MPYNRNLYSSSESAIDAGMIYDQTEEKLQSEINAEVSSDITELDDSLATFVRPNLLDNWYFVGGGSQLGDGVFPINSKGATSYSATGYTIDRLHKANSKSVLHVTADGLRFSNSSSSASDYGYFTFYGQDVPSDAFATYSVLTNLGLTTISTGSSVVTLPSGILVYLATQRLAFRIPGNLNSSDSEVIIAAKVEIGRGQTLAHQENGVWVLNEIPNFTEELTKCQREDGNFIETVPFDLSTTPTSNTYGKYIGAKDKNDYVWFYMQPVHNTVGRLSMMYAVRRLINGSPVTNGFYLGINADGSLAVTVDSPTAWTTAINALPKTGGTLTGNIGISSGSPGVYLNNPDLDVTASSYTAGNSVGLRLRDKNNKIVAMVTDRRESDGRTGVWITGWKTVNGADTSNGLSLYIDKDGHKVVSVSEAAPWRTAIGALNKAGDTMTGIYRFKGSNLDKDVAANSWSDSYPVVADKDGDFLGNMRAFTLATGVSGVQLTGQHGSYQNYLRLGETANNEHYVDVTSPGTWRKALGLCYNVNETYSHNGPSLVINGIINGSKKNIYLDFVTDKSMENISTVTVTSMNGYLYGVAGTMIGSATNFAASPYTVNCDKQGFHHVRITVTSSSALPNAFASSPVTYFGSLSLKFT